MQTDKQHWDCLGSLAWELSSCIFVKFSTFFVCFFFASWKKFITSASKTQNDPWFMLFLLRKIPSYSHHLEWFEDFFYWTSIVSELLWSSRGAVLCTMQHSMSNTDVPVLGHNYLLTILEASACPSITQSDNIQMNKMGTCTYPHKNRSKKIPL